MGLVTSFVGRRDVTRQLDSLIDEERLVTLTGTGGIGKTRLAAEVTALREGAGATAALVELAPAGPEDDLELTLVRQLGQASIDMFVVGLDGASALVVLDNCEHVAANAAALAARLIAFPNVRVLATSRSPLSVPGEYVVTLGPLRVAADAGDESAPAFELFLDRAVTAGANWVDVPEQRAAVAEIVRRLDGIPLAIELAAARSRAIGPTDLLPLLARQLDLLDDGGRRSSAGPRSVRSAVEASYQPMDPECQGVFRALSLIPQGVDFEFAMALAGEEDELVMLDLLTRLVDHSLVYTSPGVTGDLVYRLLEPVRAYGLERLEEEGEAGEVGHRYVDAVCRFAHEIVVATATSFSGSLIDQIAHRYVHLLHAIEIALEIDELPDRAYRLLLPLYAPTKAPRREQAQLAARVRERWPDTPDRFRAAAYAIMGHVALWAGTEDPTPFAREAIDDPGATRIARIIALRVLAFEASQRGDREGARASIESALAVAASRGGSFERELKMSWASLVDDPGDVDEAIEQAEEMSQLAMESGEAVTVVWGACVCVHQHLRRGRVPAARVAAERAMTFAQRAASPWPTASAERALALVCTAEGRLADAFGHFRSALDSVLSAGDVEGVTLTVRLAAICAEHNGEHQVARQLWASVPTRFRPSALPPVFAEAEDDLLHDVGEPLVQTLGHSLETARPALALAESTAAEADPETDGPATEETAGGEVFRFNGYELDPVRRELRQGGEVVHIEPQVFDVLLRLIDDAGRFVAKETLLDDVWGGRFVSASALTSRIKSARAATGDDGKRQKVIRTVHGRGFMFVADLDERPTVVAGPSASDELGGG